MLAEKIKDVLDEEVFLLIFDEEDEVSRERARQYYREQAIKQGKAKEFDSLYKAYKKDCEDINKAVKYSKHTEINFILDNKIPMKIKENMKILLDHKAINVKYNEMTKRIEFSGIKHDESIADTTFTNIRDMCTKNGFKLNKDYVYDFIQAIATDNRYNPVTDFLNECKAKTDVGDSEIKKLISTIHYATSDKEAVQFYNKMLVKWLLGCINIAFNTLEDNRNLEFVLTFKGEQGLGKTRWANSFVPRGMYKDGITLNLEKTDSIMQATKYWVVELGEIGSTFKKSDIDKLKSFITTKVDEYRSPYGRSSCMYPRRTAFIGTVNDEKFLTDKTGNRRFVVLPVIKLDYENDIDPAKLWGELMHLYEAEMQKGAALYMTKEEQHINDIYNLNYTKKSDAEIALDDVFDWNSKQLGACSISMIVSYIREQTGCVYKNNQIQEVLTKKGYTTDRFYAGKAGKKTQGRFYKLPFVEGLSLPF